VTFKVEQQPLVGSNGPMKPDGVIKARCHEVRPVWGVWLRHDGDAQWVFIGEVSERAGMDNRVITEWFGCSHPREHSWFGLHLPSDRALVEGKVRGFRWQRCRVWCGWRSGELTVEPVLIHLKRCDKGEDRSARLVRNDLPGGE
jgi:hypothetical protein